MTRDEVRGPGPSPSWPLALAAAAAGTATATAAWLAARRRLVQRLVPKDLRSPMLYVPLQFTTATVPVIDRMWPGSSVPLDVRHDLRMVPAETGRPAVPVHVYRPRAGGGALPVVLFVHGGGFVALSTSAYHDWCSRLVQRLGACVVSVEYRVAPRNPFPAPLDDCHAALVWVLENADSLGVDTDRLAVSGDSAGGGLAACLAQRAHDERIPVAFQALVYPMLDDRTCLRPTADGRGEFLWTPESNTYGWTSYLGRAPSEDAAPPYAVAARRVDLAGLPPAWIGVGSLDLFAPEDVRYAERLRAAGVPTTLTQVEGFYHGADRIRPDAEETRRLWDAYTGALADALLTHSPQEDPA